MKKTILFGAVAGAMSLGLTSCDLDSPESFTTVQKQTLNLVSPLNGEGDSFVAKSTYQLKMSSKSTLELRASKLAIPGKEIDFSTNPIKYQAGIIQTTAGNGEVTYFNDGTASSAGVSVSNLNGVLSGLTYWYNYTVPGFQNPVFQETSPALVMQYTLNDQYAVRTFPQTAFYRGATRLQYSINGQGGNVFEKSPISYRVSLSDDFKTADLMLFDCQFAEAMPADKAPKCLVLRNLKVEYTNGGYTISADEVTPAQPEGTVLVDNKNFTFKNIRISTVSNDLTKVNLSYSVNGKLSVNMGPAGVRDIVIEADARADGISYCILTAPTAQQ